ncbi:ankyrin repeat domain-containing protein [Wolbachia endosymbiont (group A) of Sphaerophoria taeniata]|uniref:ankyrin repeat domain-containing protein n=2 Tax=unclassified Wolbachia TaxID=2640676 RepID=UPI002227B511|nr:ankyrin repeat domain-containing protein [Wolbachia endosymbiont (group A) of Sphaerophoria taeniata]
MNGGVPSKGLNEQLRDILDKLEQDINLLDNPGYIQHIMFLLGAGADPNTTGTQGEKTLSDYSSEKLRDILNELASNSDLLDNSNYTRYIMFLLQAGADPNIRRPDGKTLSYYLNEKLGDILDGLESDRGLLYYYAKHISLLLQAGADRNTQNQYGKTLSHYSNEPLLNILNALESNGDILDNYLPYIMSLLQAGANRDTQNRYEKTLSYYLDKRLSDILESNRAPLNNIQHIILLLEAGANPNVQNREDGKTLLHYVAEHNDTGGIRFLLGAGANPNVQDQSEKTPLHYAAENNCLQAIELLLKAKADQNVQDQSGKTPFEYVTEHECRQAIKDLGYDLDDSHENEGNPTTPDDSVDDCSNSSGDDSQIESVKLSDCNTEEDSDYHSDGSCENEENLTNDSSNYPNKHNDDQALRDDPGYSSGDDNKTISTEPSDCDRKDEDSSCSSSDHLFLEDLLSMKLEIPLTTSEEGLIKDFCEKIRGITAQNKQESEESILESIEKIVNEYLKKGIRLNSSCSNGNENDNGDKETVTSLILEEIEGVLNNRVKPRDENRARERQSDGIADQDDGNEDKVSGIIESITNKLLLKGGKARQKFFSGNTELAQNYGSNYINDLSKKYKETKDKLKSIAYESIVGRDRQAQKGEPEEVDIDNVCFYVKYSQDSIIEPVKIFNKAEDLNLKVGILQVGESIVRAEGTKDGKRNYTDVLESSIKMSFTTEAGEINIYLSPSEKDSNKIEVEIYDESEERLNKLKAEKKSLGENCLLGGKSVLEAIEEKGFKKNGNVPTESIETIKDVPRTDVTQACSQQINTRAKGK